MTARRSLVLLLAVTLIVACTPGRAALTFTPDVLADAHAGQAYEQRIDIGQAATPVGGISIQDGALPAGLSIEKIAGEDAAGRIVGTPTAAGTFTFTVFAWCYGTNVSGQTGTKAYTLVVR